MIWTCFGHDLGMFRTSFGHVSDMIWTCFGHHPDMFGMLFSTFWHIFFQNLKFHFFQKFEKSQKINQKAPTVPPRVITPTRPAPAGPDGGFPPIRGLAPPDPPWGGSLLSFFDLLFQSWSRLVLEVKMKSQRLPKWHQNLVPWGFEVGKCPQRHKNINYQSPVAFKD